MKILAQGVYDIDNYSNFRDEILEALAQEDRVEIDMAGVTFIDSSGLSCLVEGLQHAQQLNKELVLVSPSEKVMDILRMSALEPLFDIIESSKIDAPQAQASEFDEPDLSAGEWEADFDLDSLSLDLNQGLNDLGPSEPTEKPADDFDLDASLDELAVDGATASEEISPAPAPAPAPTEDLNLDDALRTIEVPERVTEKSAKNNLNVINSDVQSPFSSENIEDYDDDPMNQI